MYRITYEQGNGYRCGCCRSTYTQTVDLETKEEVQDWVNELHASFKVPEWEDDDDRSIESIEKEFGVDIQDQFPPDQKEVDHIIAQRKRNKAEEEEKDKQEELERKEEKEKAELLRLKNKYESS